MSNFNTALKITLGFEGGLVNDPEDPGGMTNMGISLRFLKNCGLKYDFNHDGKIDTSEIKNLTQEQAATIYRDEFWNPCHFSDIKDQAVANYLFDMAVNMGHFSTTELVQWSLRAISNAALQNYKGGLLLGFIENINNCFPHYIRIALRSHRAMYYRNLAQKDNKMEFLNGWLARTYSDKFWSVDE